MDITIIHLSDLHFRLNWEEAQDVVLSEFFGDLRGQVKKLKKSKIHIAFSGDVVLEGGKRELYKEFFVQFNEKLDGLGLPKKRRFCVPGNHDLSQNFVKENYANHEGIVSQGLSERDFNDYISELNNIFYKKFEHYLRFESKFANMGVTINNVSGAGWDIEENISVYCLNSALCSSGSIEKNGRRIEDKERLAIDTRSLHKWTTSCDSKWKVLIMHHPVNCLTEWAQSELNTILNKHFSLYLSGHNHNPDMHNILKRDSSLVCCSAPPLFTRKYDDLGYSIVTINPRFGVVDIVYRQWSKNHQAFVTGVSFSGTDDGRIKILTKTQDIKRADASSDNLIRSQLERRFEDALRSFSTQPIVWVEPILNKVSEVDAMTQFESDPEPDIDLDDFISKPKSVMIKALPQFGLTCLAHYLCKEAWITEKSFWLYLDSENLKHYLITKSIKSELKLFGFEENDIDCVVLDSWSSNEKNSTLLLQKLCEQFKEIPIIVMHADDNIGYLISADIGPLNREFEIYYLWTLSRGHIRKMVTDYNEQKYIGETDSVLSKVALDLEGLNLPRTPLNCLLLLKASEIYFDDSPVNRTEVINRILFILFNRDEIPGYKERPDLKDCEHVLGYFCETLLREQKFEFTRGEFLERLQAFCRKQLIYLEVGIVFDVLYQNNILVKNGDLFTFRFTYWIYYFIAQRMYHNESLANFIFEDSRYASFPEIIEFYTGIDRSRQSALDILIEDIQTTCKVVEEKCGFPSELNLYKNAQWKLTEGGLEKLKEELEDGMTKSNLPDSVKDKYIDSYYDRTRPYYQEIQDILREYSLRLLLQTMKAGSRALRNSDYVDPTKKKQLLQVIMRSWEQISFVLMFLSPILAKQRYATFDGTNIQVIGGEDLDPEDMFFLIITSIPSNMIFWCKDDIYSRKMGPLLIDKFDNEKSELIRHYLILLLIKQKPPEWKARVEKYIASIEKNSFFLMDVCRALQSEYRYSYSPRNTLDDLKYLIKMVLIKHEHGVKKPGEKMIKKISDKVLPKRPLDKF